MPTITRKYTKTKMRTRKWGKKWVKTRGRVNYRKKEKEKWTTWKMLSEARKG